VIRKAIPPGTRLLLLSMWLATAPIGYLIVVLPLYLSRAGLEPAFIGLLYTASGAVSASLVAVSGVLADRFGRRRFLLAGTALPVLSYAIFATTVDRPWLIIASLLGGVGLANGAAGALSIGSFEAILAERAGQEQRTRVFAWAQALWSLSLATGALAAALPEALRAAGLTELDAYRPGFLGAIALTLAATAALLPLGGVDVGLAETRAQRGWLPRRSRGAIGTYALGIGLLGFGLGVAVQLMPLWLNLRFGATEADLAPWYAAGQLLSLATVLAIPALERRLGGARSVLLAQLVSASSLALILVAPAFALAAALFVVRSFATNLAWPFQQALLMSAVVPAERASAVGAGFAVWGFANALGPVLGGALLGAGLLAPPLLIGATAYACAGAVFGLGFRDQPSASAARASSIAS
jgi:MFS family permease